MLNLMQVICIYNKFALIVVERFGGLMQANSSITPDMQPSNLSWDSYGGIASTLCVVHCLTISFAPAIIDNVSFLSANNELFEWGFFGLAVLFGLTSATVGIRKHRNVLVLGSFVAGLSILVLGRLGEAMSLFEGGEALSIAGGIFLFIAHMYSSRCCSGIEHV